MREIKFRAWHKKQELMLTIESIDWTSQICENDKIGFVSFKEGIDVWEENIEGYSRYEIEYACDLDEVILMQFTGLFDRTGKEVYEGDIMRYSPYEDESIEDEAKYFEIEYKLIDYDTLFNVAIGFSFKYELHKCTIAGNIYENPELLEKDHE